MSPGRHVDNEFRYTVSTVPEVHRQLAVRESENSRTTEHGKSVGLLDDGRLVGAPKVTSSFDPSAEKTDDCKVGAGADVVSGLMICTVILLVR
jgi:hypothetical protein